MNPINTINSMSQAAAANDGTARPTRSSLTEAGGGADPLSGGLTRAGAGSPVRTPTATAPGFKGQNQTQLRSPRPAGVRPSMGSPTGARGPVDFQSALDLLVSEEGDTDRLLAAKEQELVRALRPSPGTLPPTAATVGKLRREIELLHAISSRAKQNKATGLGVNDPFTTARPSAAPKPQPIARPGAATPSTGDAGPTPVANVPRPGTAAAAAAAAGGGQKTRSAQQRLQQQQMMQQQHQQKLQQQQQQAQGQQPQQQQQLSSAQQQHKQQSQLQEHRQQPAQGQQQQPLPGQTPVPGQAPPARAASPTGAPLDPEQAAAAKAIAAENARLREQAMALLQKRQQMQDLVALQAQEEQRKLEAASRQRLYNKTDVPQPEDKLIRPPNAYMPPVWD